MFYYETHMHTAPVSNCAKASVEESLSFYKEQGYDGVFITNHFLDGNIQIPRERPYEERLRFFFSDYEKGVKIGQKLGIKVFSGAELSYNGTDFLVYGLDFPWFMAHPELMQLSVKEKLAQIRQAGGFVVQAHPFREAGYIDHIRLFPRSVDGVEVINACRTELENKMAALYAENYGFYQTAGSDNHVAGGAESLAGMMSQTPVTDEQDFIRKIKTGEMELFVRKP